MRKRLSYVNPYQVGKVLAVLYALLSLIFVPFGLLAVFLSPNNGNHAASLVGGGVFLVLFPVLYTVLGFVFGVIFAAIYNVVAKWTGGIEFIVTDVPGEPAPALPSY